MTMNDPEPDQGDDIEAAPAAENGPAEAGWPVTYAHAEAAYVAAEGQND